MWDLPRPGLEPVSPALAGRFSTTAPPGKPHRVLLMCVSCGLSRRVSTSPPPVPTVGALLGSLAESPGLHFPGCPVTPGYRLHPGTTQSPAHAQPRLPRHHHRFRTSCSILTKMPFSALGNFNFLASWHVGFIKTGEVTKIGKDSYLRIRKVFSKILNQKPNYLYSSYTAFNLLYSWPLNYVGFGVPIPYTVKNLWITLQFALHIRGSKTWDSTNFGLCNTVVFTIEKYLQISGPVQFKPVLRKRQL